MQIKTRNEWMEAFTAPTVLKQQCLILNESQITECFNKGERFTYVGYHDDKHCVVFFTSTYFFTDNLGAKFVHCSSIAGSRAVPRPGCEDGWMNTFDKYKAVHCVDTTIIYSYEELIDFLDKLGMVEREE